MTSLKSSRTQFKAIPKSIRNREQRECLYYVDFINIVYAMKNFKIVKQSLFLCQKKSPVRNDVLYKAIKCCQGFRQCKTGTLS